MTRTRLLFCLTLGLSLLSSISALYAKDAQAPAGTILGIGSTKKPSRLVYVDVETGDIHELLPGDVSGPCFSPDGQNIAFIYKDMIYVAPRNNIEARREVVPTPGAYKNHLSWTDDNYLYFAEGKTIYRVKASGGEKEKVATMPSKLMKLKGGFDNLNVSNDGTRAAWWGASIIGGSGNETYSIELADPEGTLKSYGKGCRGNISPDGKYILKNGFENFHKEFFVFEYGTDHVVQKIVGGGVNYHKWPNARDGQNYVLYNVLGSRLMMSDVTTGDVWTILASQKRANVVNGFDYVKDPLSVVLSGSAHHGKQRTPAGPAVAAAPENQANLSSGNSAAVTRRISVVLSEVGTLTDPDAPDYKDALVAAVGTIQDGPFKGRNIKLLTLGMRDRKLQPVLTHWQNGARVSVEVIKLEEKLKEQPDLARTDRIDDVEDLLMVEYWAELLPQ